MDIVLIPGFWLDGDSWAPVADPLVAAGHTVHALTLPGMRADAPNAADVTLRDQIDAVVHRIDAVEAPVVLVGHSGGSTIAHAVVDARPDRVTRVIHVDAIPLGDGGCINDELPVVDGLIPLPSWDVFDDEDLVDLTEERRAHFAAIAVPEPAHVATDRQVLSDPRRYEVPATIVCCEFSSDLLREWIAGDAAFSRELAALADYELVDLPTGHWPQLTRPADLARVILAAVER